MNQNTAGYSSKTDKFLNSPLVVQPVVDPGCIAIFLSIAPSNKCVGIIDHCNARLVVPKVYEIWNVWSKLPGTILVNFRRVLSRPISITTNEPPSLCNGGSTTVSPWENEAREWLPDDLVVVQLKAVSNILAGQKIISTADCYFSINHVPNSILHL